MSIFKDDFLTHSSNKSVSYMTGPFKHNKIKRRALPTIEKIRYSPKVEAIKFNNSSSHKSKLIKSNNIINSDDSFDNDDLSVTTYESIARNNISRLQDRHDLVSSPALKNHPKLISSFSVIGDVDFSSRNKRSLSPPKKPSVETQTSSDNIKLHFEDLKDHIRWINEAVDPFLKDLKKHIITSKPSDVNQFCIDYCLALQSGQDLPTTVEAFPIISNSINHMKAKQPFNSFQDSDSECDDNAIDPSRLSPTTRTDTKFIIKVFPDIKQRIM